MSEPCEACKTIPPVVHEGYENKGEIKKNAFGGLDTYVVHPTPLPKSGILVIYDIFGLPFDQTRQGADIIALTDPGHLVVIPDFFKGEPLDISNYPPNTEEKKAAVGSFFATKANPQAVVEAAKLVMEDLKKAYPTVEAWGVFGYCWGGKVATLLSKHTEYFSAAGQVHPAMLDTSDIEGSTIPHMCLASKDEPPEAVEAYKKSLESRGDKHSYLKHFPDSIHGWMAARSNLSDPAQKNQYKEGYEETIKFFKNTLGSIVNKL